jgi:hypothetical protein
MGVCLRGRDMSVTESLDSSVLHFYTGPKPQLFI